MRADKDRSLGKDKKGASNLLVYHRRGSMRSKNGGKGDRRAGGESKDVDYGS